MDDVSDWSAVRTRPKPLTIPEMLDGMFDLWVANWRTYVLAIGAVVLPISIATSYVTVNVFGGDGLFERFTATNDPADVLVGESASSFLGLVAFAVVTAILVTPFVDAVASRIGADGYDHRRPSPADVLLRCLRRYPAIIGVSVLVLLLVALIAAPGGGLLALGVVREEPGTILVGVLLLLAAALPIVWAIVVFSLAYVCIVVEEVGPVTALRRSRTLVQPQWFRVFGTLTLANLIAGFVAQLIALPLQIPGDRWGDWAAVALAAVAGVVVSLLATPLAANAQTLLYFDARVRREGYDLQVLIDEVEQAAAGQRRG